MRSSRTRRSILWITLLALGLAPWTAQAGEGLLGIFFDSNGETCSGDVGPGTIITLYVVLQPSGSTYSGTKGGEFRVDASGATGYLVSGESYDANDAVIGSALGGGVTIGFRDCRSGRAIQYLAFQVLNAGSGIPDGVLRIVAKGRPSNPNLACPLATECDDPVFTGVCVDPGFALLNPSGMRACAGGRLKAEWSGVKELYRP